MGIIPKTAGISMKVRISKNPDVMRLELMKGGAVRMQDGGDPAARFMGRTPKRGVSSLPGYGQGNILEDIERVSPTAAGVVDASLTGIPLVGRALASPLVGLGTFATEAIKSGDPRDPTPLQRAGEAAQSFVTENLRLPQTRSGTDYLTRAADRLEQGAELLESSKIPPFIPYLGSGSMMPGLGGALKQAAKTAGKEMLRPMDQAMRGEGMLAKPLQGVAPRQMIPGTMTDQGVTYETTTEGPFYRVRPSRSQAAAGEGRGIVERVRDKAVAPGRTGSDVSQPTADEAVKQAMNDPANFVRQAASTYTQETTGKPYELPDMPESSILKQAPIGRTFMLATTDDPGYKQEIFRQYATQMPEVIKQSNATNYDELLVAAYRQMAKETDEQFKRLPVSLSYHRAGEGNYRNSKQMLQDVYGNKHLYVFQGGDEHPFLKDVDPKTGLNENEKFRAVHDFFGHAIHGNEFGPKGEEIAWAAHSQMYSPLARLAMTTETRGQNSTVNYTPLNAALKRTINELQSLRYEANRRGQTEQVKQIDKDIAKAYENFQFAPQKPLLLPPEFLSTSYAGEMPDYLRPMIKPMEGTTVSTPMLHYSKQAGLTETDPSFYGTGIKGEEAARLGLPGAISPRTYFYAGQNMEPEAGLGPHKYRAMGENLYDLAADPLQLQMLARETTRIPMTSTSNKGLAQPAEATNALERLIRDYGYAGYLSPRLAKPSVVMFGKTPVQPYAKGGKVNISKNLDTMLFELMMANPPRMSKAGKVNKAEIVAQAMKDAAKAAKQAQKEGPPRQTAIDRAETAERAVRKQKGFDKMRPSDQEMTIQAARAKALGVGIERSTVNVQAALPDEKDVAKSLMNVPAYKKANAIPISAIEDAKRRRAAYREEPAVTPGPKASEKEWEKWGQSFGVNMTLSKPVPLGISDPQSKREIKIPGGLEGTFTIPDMFWMKANNVNPAALPKDVHDQLMLKFIRTHNVSEPDQVDIFNRLNFALLSPNAPLTQNEFLAMRARIRDMDELRALAARKGEPNLAQNLAEEMGVSSAGKGGLGVLGTANLGNQAELARLILEKPEMFQIQPGETMRDVTMRVMNQVPGLGPKTASLGTPWLDLEKANTSAVDLHMIRDATPRLLNDPDVGDAFRERMGKLLGVEPTLEAILAQPAKKIQDKAVQIVGGTDVSRMYRTRQGDLSNIPESATPDKLVYEPKKFREFNPFYNKVVEYVDESRGTNPVIELFPEQWRKWDIIRERIEPHEFAHPDYRNLPKSSFSEMLDALEAHKKAGYTGTKPVMGQSDWRKLYYGALAPIGVGLGAGALSEMDTGTDY